MEDPYETPAVTSFHTEIWSILLAYLLIWIAISFFAVRRPPYPWSTSIFLKVQFCMSNFKSHLEIKDIITLILLWCMILSPTF